MNTTNKFIQKIKQLAQYFTIVLVLVLLTISCKEDNEVCEYDGFPYSCEKGMDVVFLIDYTGSMGGAINDIKANVPSIVNTIVTESAGDYRLGLSIFDEYQKGSTPTYNSVSAYTSLPAAQKKTITTGIVTDQFLTVLEKFNTSNQTNFSTQLNLLNGTMPMGWGIGGPEPGDLLLNEILNNSFAGAFRPNVTKLAIIITDATASGDDDNATTLDDTYLANLANTANSMGVQCCLLTTYPNSNYKLQLINNNASGFVSELTSFNNLAQDINTMIKNLCTQNDQTIDK